MDTRLTASRTATPPDPASIGTDQQSTDLIKRWSTAGRPVAIVSPMVSVKADTPVHAMTGTTTAQDVTIDQETAYRWLLAAFRMSEQQTTGHNESSAPSASGGELLMSNPAATNDTESDLLVTSVIDLPPRCNIL
ncbi:hypothetical protein [Endozoicomonas sp. GU-1]|uniref:hypothetical protein n=1 Tax=Endozoicomonas sp. GU-1 TaxID=3009078 RepID=UPI0022B5D1B0|nr:hypothetical protein [Endozoicomonas sp. GU-1]WBA81764.1 hypothetical protein O2T12_00885 [Endozoicomonas sp. GU-1]WBA84719.1 hypothetical protein O3276_15690 [Endozoicomonas sp. GU-1]